MSENRSSVARRSRGRFVGGSRVDRRRPPPRPASTVPPPPPTPPPATPPGASPCAVVTVTAIGTTTILLKPRRRSRYEDARAVPATASHSSHGAGSDVAKCVTPAKYRSNSFACKPSLKTMAATQKRAAFTEVAATAVQPRRLRSAKAAGPSNLRLAHVLQHLPDPFSRCLSQAPPACLHPFLPGQQQCVHIAAVLSHSVRAQACFL